MIIDTHQHFWNYNPTEFDWITPEMSPIKRSFLPVDLESVLSNSNVDGVISVQARQSVEETDWLLSLGSHFPFMKGVVGWLPLASPRIEYHLEKYSSFPLLKGVRHVIQGEPDPEFILRKDFNRGIALLASRNLVYEILIYQSQIPNTIRFVRQHPNQQFVIDHFAKPQIKTNQFESWRDQMSELAKCQNVVCKISGLVTEADYQSWTEKQLWPYFETVLEVFGPNRLMFGSDWPVCLVAIDYHQWISLVRKNISLLSESEQESILSKNAIRIYHLSIK